MDQTIELRQARDTDTALISDLVRKTIRTSNAPDYPAHVIRRLTAEHFSPGHIRDWLTSRFILIACEGDTVIGTASLEANMVRAVFVAPDRQRMGIGRMLMDAVEIHARQRGLDTLEVQSSLTAIQFYKRRGYAEIKEVSYGDERTVLMRKPLSP